MDPPPPTQPSSSTTGLFLERPAASRLEEAHENFRFGAAPTSKKPLGFPSLHRAIIAANEKDAAEATETTKSRAEQLKLPLPDMATPAAVHRATPPTSPPQPSVAVEVRDNTMGPPTGEWQRPAVPHQPLKRTHSGTGLASPTTSGLPLRGTTDKGPQKQPVRRPVPGGRGGLPLRGRGRGLVSRAAHGSRLPHASRRPTQASGRSDPGQAGSTPSDCIVVLDDDDDNNGKRHEDATPVVKIEDDTGDVIETIDRVTRAERPMPSRQQFLQRPPGQPPLRRETFATEGMFALKRPRVHERQHSLSSAGLGTSPIPFQPVAPAANSVPDTQMESTDNTLLTTVQALSAQKSALEKNLNAVRFELATKIKTAEDAAAKNTELNHQLEARKKEVTDVKAKLVKLDKFVQGLGTDYNVLNQKNAYLKQQLSDLGQHKKDVDKTLDELREKLRDVLHENQVWTKGKPEVLQLRGELDMLRERIQRLDKELAEKTGLLIDERDRVNSLEMQLREERKDHARVIGMLEKTREDIVPRFRELEQTLLEKMSEEGGMTTARFEECLSQIKEVWSGGQQMRDSLQRIDATVILNSNNIDGLKEQTRTVSETTEQSSDVMRKLHDELSSLKEELSAAREKEKQVRILTNEKESLASRLSRAESENQVIEVRFQVSREHLERKISDLEAKLQTMEQLSKEDAEARVTTENLQKQLGEAEKQIEHLLEKLHTTESKAQTLRAEYEHQKRELESTRTLSAELTSRVERFEAEKAAYIKEETQKRVSDRIEYERKSNSFRNQEKQKYLAQIGTLEGQKQDLEEKLRSYTEAKNEDAIQATVDQLREKCESLTKELCTSTEATWSELEDLKKTKQELSEAVKVKDSQIADLEGTVDELQARIDEQRGMINAKQEAVRAIDKELGTVQCEKEALQSRVSGLELQLEQLKTQQCSTDDTRSAEMSHEIQSWEQSYNILRTSNTSTLQRVQQLENELYSEKQKYTEIMAKNDQLSHELIEAKKEAKIHSDMIVSLERKLALNDERNASTRKAANDKEVALRNAKGKLAVARSENAAMEKRLDHGPRLNDGRVGKASPEPQTSSTPLSSPQSILAQESGFLETPDDSEIPIRFAAQIRKETLFTDDGPEIAVEEIQQIVDQLDVRRPEPLSHTVPQVGGQTPRRTKVTIGINTSGCGNKAQPMAQDHCQTPHKDQKTAMSPPIIVKGAKRPAPTRIRPTESELRKSPDVPQPRRRRTRQNVQEAQLTKTATPLHAPRRVGKRRLNAVEDDEQDALSGTQASPPKPDQSSVHNSVKKLKPNKRGGKK